MKSILIIISCFLSYVAIFAQDKHAIEIEYYLTLSEKEFIRPPIYLEKNIIQDNYKYTLASLPNSDDNIVTENQDNSSTSIFPKFLYRLNFNYLGNALEAHEPIMLRSANAYDLYAIIDSVNNLNWNITEQSKIIEGYKCILATTEFRCREYYAWFTPDIPISYGPWKLHGLPGLIIEAYDKENIRHYTLGKYAKILKNNSFINEVRNGEVREKLPISKVSDYYAKIEENFKAINAIGNTSMDCLNCPNTKSKISVNTWECY